MQIALQFINLWNNKKLPLGMTVDDKILNFELML